MKIEFYGILFVAVLSAFLSNGNSSKVKRDTTCLNAGKWRPSINTCACNYSWTGHDCSKWRHQFCYFDYGKNYRGQLSHTTNGVKCLLWTTDHNNHLYEIGKNGVGVHNYCRNPDNDPMGIWCYVGGENLTEYCNATVCPESLRMPNTTFLDENDESESTIKFLFGPLISGVCGGVVALLLIIGVAECVRRKGYCEQKQKKKKTPKKEKKEKIKYPKFESNDEWAIDSYDVQPLGGVVTVNLDTGEHRRHLGNEEVIPTIPITNSNEINQSPTKTKDTSPKSSIQKTASSSLSQKQKLPHAKPKNKSLENPAQYRKPAVPKNQPLPLKKDSNYIEYV